MITNYGLFNHHDDNNALLILFSDDKVDNEKQINGIFVLFSNNKIVGYKIPDFIRIAKIKYSGIVFLPSNPLIDAINHILSNCKLETLAYKNDSGYHIKTIDGQKFVFAEKGTFLRDETVSNGRCCSYFDLYIDNIEPNKIITLDNQIDDLDFFKMEAK
ncbi:MAG: hypothetical protein MJ227_00645 [Bacilli bacterium]|nr:hypothetical protein [Bacilli bacterium]